MNKEIITPINISNDESDTEMKIYTGSMATQFINSLQKAYSPNETYYRLVIPNDILKRYNKDKNMDVTENLECEGTNDDDESNGLKTTRLDKIN